jgi:hypothetical protein
MPTSGSEYAFSRNRSKKVDAWYSSIAAEIGCTIDEVKAVTPNLMILDWQRPEARRAFRDNEKHLVNAAQHILRALDALELLDEQVREELVEERRHLFEVVQSLSSTAGMFEDIGRSIPAEGGKNLAAHFVAEFVFKTYKSTGRKITFGENDGQPSTAYGRSVKNALSITGVQADWKGPAKAALNADS